MFLYQPGNESRALPYFKRAMICEKVARFRFGAFVVTAQFVGRSSSAEKIDVIGNARL